jgi:putative hydroxymethylpyrimidine transport system substrate-binding protein
MSRRHPALIALIAAVLTALAAVGPPAAAATKPQTASLMLDFTPNAIHTGIYTALARHDDTANGIKLQIRIPGESTDAISLLSAGRVDFAILDIHDLAIADEQGHQLVGIMALEQRPLASVIAQPRFKSPKQLDGQTIGVTGDPSDLAVLRSVVAGAGGKPSSLETITIGYLT